MALLPQRFEHPWLRWEPTPPAMDPSDICSYLILSPHDRAQQVSVPPSGTVSLAQIQHRSICRNVQQCR
jgi:hypothetical protein